MSAPNETTRLETFCDGVFAIAITLLVIEIKVPPIESIHSIHEFWQAIGHLWTHFFGYVLSFMVILIAWVNHHNLFKLIRRNSTHFMYANGLLLLSVAILPFPTALMADYIGTEFAQPAIFLYCVSGLFHNMAWNVLLLASHKPIDVYKPTVSKKIIKVGENATRGGMIVYAGVTALSWWYPVPALIITTVMWIAYLILGMVISVDEPGTESEEAGERLSVIGNR